jgi:hypothetical protein
MLPSYYSIFTIHIRIWTLARALQHTVYTLQILQCLVHEEVQHSADGALKRVCSGAQVRQELLVRGVRAVHQVGNHFERKNWRPTQLTRPRHRRTLHVLGRCVILSEQPIVRVCVIQRIRGRDDTRFKTQRLRYHKTVRYYVAQIRFSDKNHQPE